MSAGESDANVRDDVTVSSCSRVQRRWNFHPGNRFTLRKCFTNRRESPVRYHGNHVKINDVVFFFYHFEQMLTVQPF